MRSGSRGQLRDWIKLGLATADRVDRRRHGLPRAAHGDLGRAHPRPRLPPRRRSHRLGRRGQPVVVHHHRRVPPPDGAAARSLRRAAALLRRARVAGEIDLPHDAAAVTFDDGYRDVLLRADPILRELGIPATVFVPTGFAEATGRDQLLPHDRLYAAAWAAERSGRGLAGFGDTETALILARADRVLAQVGPAGVVEDLDRRRPRRDAGAHHRRARGGLRRRAARRGRARGLAGRRARARRARLGDRRAHRRSRRAHARVARGAAPPAGHVQAGARALERPPLPLLRLLQRLPLAVARRRAAPRRLRRRGHHVRSPELLARRRSLPHRPQGPVGRARARPAAPLLALAVGGAPARHLRLARPDHPGRRRGARCRAPYRS